MEDLGRQTVSAEMRQFCLTTTCRRQFITKHFGFDVPADEGVAENTCCDICEKDCDTSIKSADEPISQTAVNEVQQALRYKIQHALVNLFYSLPNTNGDLINTASTNGLSSTLAFEIAQVHTQYIKEASFATVQSHKQGCHKLHITSN